MARVVGCLLVAMGVLIVCSSAATEEELQDICKNTQNPGVCLKALKSDPRTPKADLKGLCKIALDISLKEAQSLLTDLKKINEKSPALKRRYEYCAEFYDDAAFDLDKAKEYEAEGDYISIGVIASAVDTNSNDCTDDLAERPGGDPCKIEARNYNFRSLLGPLFVISSRLKQRM